ncbi:ATP-binding cassette domain-containing protein [Vibrio sp. SCSIO 43169]|uniref:ATP-binding cassette domain-containing protein n=1 Tax=Vibrio sp. SCSIO 43169 TaxID=2822801 RepID=UPI002043F3D6|nr:ATP-binding cassette domain-containing protein [Vibrio sp. SCSIO 43169]MCM5506917.1 ABC-F family ATP-binding cassette domain-containing protein [Vibrio sp. SCSIO 43169]
MPALIASQISHQLETGEWLFRSINLSLNHRITGLTGKSGSGKSVLLSILTGDCLPDAGNVERQGRIATYSQLPSELLVSDMTIAQYLGIDDKRQALRAIEQGSTRQEDFDRLSDDWEVEQRAIELMAQLSIALSLDDFCCHLSGGQLAKLQLYHLFQQSPDVLLLDEPTNHLDTQGKQWLINKLKAFPGKILLVSHDRALLRCADVICHLSPLGLKSYRGIYDEFQRQYNVEKQALSSKIDNLKSEKKKIERQIQLNAERAQQREAMGNRARRSGSQPKILMDAMKDSAQVTRSAAITNQNNQLKRNQHKLETLKSRQEDGKEQSFYLAHTQVDKRHNLASIADFSVDKSRWQTVSIRVETQDRIHLSGNNGCGKSTLLKALSSPAGRLVQGIKCNVKTVYLDQHFSLLCPNMSMLDTLRNSCPKLAESDARTLLAGVGFRRDSVYKMVSALSGGEKMKLAVLMVSHQSCSPLLLLDEPDNHLDIDSKQRLAKALSTYPGPFILVSHDQDFVDEAGINKTLEIKAV